jgi:hypothetical protein
VRDALARRFKFLTADTRRPRDEYIAKILEPNTWGGAIELAIFAEQCVVKRSLGDQLTVTQLQDGDCELGRRVWAV